MNTHVGIGDDARHGRTNAIALHDEVITGGLKDIQIRLVFDNIADRTAVQRAVGLGTGGTHGRTFTAVKRTELNTGFVGSARHGTAEGINFFHQMAFADAANRRIT